MSEPNQLDEDKKGLVGKVYGVYVDYSTNLCSGEITFKNKEALDYYIAKAQTEARIELVKNATVKIENIPIYDVDSSNGTEFQAGYNDMAEATRIFKLEILSILAEELNKSEATNAGQ